MGNLEDFYNVIVLVVILIAFGCFGIFCIGFAMGFAFESGFVIIPVVICIAFGCFCIGFAFGSGFVNIAFGCFCIGFAMGFAFGSGFF